MATVESSGLYPPILESYAPVFIGDICIIYFQLSPYMENKTYNLEVIVNEQKRNMSVLKGETLKVAAKPVIKDNQILTNQYYFTIEADNLKDGFELNTFYRVQARIIEAGVSSEWSKVCLIRRISDFKLSLVGSYNPNTNVLTYTSPFGEINGSFIFEDNENIETIKSAKIQLFNSLNEVQVEEVILLDQSNINNYFSYQIPIQLLQNESYLLKINAETKNGAEKEFLINIIATYTFSTITSVVKTELDKENGLINIKVDIQDAEINDKGLVILRTDNNSNFKIWEELHVVKLENATSQRYEWKDKTIEYGLWYKYSLQLKDNNGNTSILSEETSPIFANFDDTLLTQQDKQLKVSLNRNISNLTRNLSQSKIDTLGGEFPFIVRSGHTNYRNFPLSGTISYLGNNEEVLFATDDIKNNNLKEENKAGLFETKESIYKESYTSYELYNLENNISNTNNTYLERRFREEVEKFLNDFKPKLFRSPTEGNLLVQLMDVSLSPNNQLGGYIYDFSCTVIEIAKCTIENFDKKGIQSIGQLPNEQIEKYNLSTIEKVGQV